MRLIVDQSLAAGFIPINTWQPSLPFKPGQGYFELCSVNACAGKKGILQWRYNIPLRLWTFVKPSCDNVAWLRGSGCNTLSNSGLANINIRKRIFILLICCCSQMPHPHSTSGNERGWKLLPHNPVFSDHAPSDFYVVLQTDIPYVLTPFSK